MNPFYDISVDENLPDDSLKLKNLGLERIFAITGGGRGSDFWGTGRTSNRTTHYTKTVPEDYDNLFAHKIRDWKPVYELNKVLEYHFGHYCNTSVLQSENFLKHIRYIILPRLKKLNRSEVQVDLVEQWLKTKENNDEKGKVGQVVNNNTIQMGDIHAPIQFQQNSNNSIQNQSNHYHKDDIQKVFELLSKDIQNVNEKIREDFAMEMDYAVMQLNRGKDIKQQLLNLGTLMRDVGLGVFTNVVASPICEVIKPSLGL
ncbi:MAG: hypothetical protein BGO88_08510 [Flavobacterium sp. 38-13]|uniref:hypothetical protein n=1 Tax=Flavobacterium sp. 38-13 TaxID=1896168 RepID=UPI00095CE75D|nr:hypothetical protein [Flavobacterium sp. 38-13]OJX49788.1 MAG: hypothetical protein BGO88_08510 [Flavobacterium sp. 38-13]